MNKIINDNPEGMADPEDERIARKHLLSLLDQANPQWPMYLGHPQTGEPVELAKTAFERIKRCIRETLDE